MLTWQQDVEPGAVAANSQCRDHRPRNMGGCQAAQDQIDACRFDFLVDVLRAVLASAKPRPQRCPLYSTERRRSTVTNR